MQLKARNYSFFPLNRAMCLEDEEDKYEKMMKAVETNMEQLVLQFDNMVSRAPFTLCYVKGKDLVLLLKLLLGKFSLGVDLVLAPQMTKDGS